MPVESFRSRLAGTAVPGPITVHDSAGQDRLPEPGWAIRPSWHARVTAPLRLAAPSLPSRWLT
jgi:hypothetical protein